MLHHAPSAANPVNPIISLQGTNSLADEAWTGGNPEVVAIIELDPPITSGTVVALGMITNAELETVVRGPDTPGRLLLSGTRAELGRTNPTVLGNSVELLLEEVDKVLLGIEEDEEGAALDEDTSEVEVLLGTLLDVELEVEL